MKIIEPLKYPHFKTIVENIHDYLKENEANEGQKYLDYLCCKREIKDYFFIPQKKRCIIIFDDKHWFEIHIGKYSRRMC